MQSSHGAQRGGCTCVFINDSPDSNQDVAFVFSCESEVCTRSTDDACLIRVTVNTPTSVVGSHSKLPSSVIILIVRQLFSMGSRVLHFDIKSFNFGFDITQTTTSYSQVFSSCSHTSSLMNLGPVTRLDYSEGQTRSCAGLITPTLILHQEQAIP